MTDIFNSAFKFFAEMGMWMRIAIVASVIALLSDNIEMYILVPLCWAGYWIWLGASKDKVKKRGHS